MNVQQFVRECLLQIANAVEEANSQFRNQGLDAMVNPRGALSESKGGGSYLSVSDTHNVEFDIALTASETSESSNSKGAGLALSVLRANGDTSSTNQSSLSNVSRIKITIPLKLPRPPKDGS